MAAPLRLPGPLSRREAPAPAWLAFLLAALLLAPVPNRGGEGAAVGEATPESLAPPQQGDAAALRAQHLARLGAARWHAAGHRGRGITVAVLDSGFRGYRSHLGRSLPAQVRVRSFRHDGNLEARDSQHGILCGEVVHAVAPEAGLLFANWEPETPESFLDAVRWARSQGARIITCSLIMPSWSDGEGGGQVHARLAEALGGGDGPGDALCFACAGNTAERHWSGLFRDDGTGFHAWCPGECDNRLSPWHTDRVAAELCWHPGADYELSVHDAATGERLAVSLPEPGVARCCTVVRFVPQVRQRYSVRVRLVRGTAGRFHLVTLGAGLEHATAAGSIPFPGDGAEVVAVGAVDNDDRRLAYSSCGPNSPRPKPDLVAPVPFPSLWRSRPFSGTSAAAPQAAALAALWWARYPDWSANRIREALTAAARDVLPPGHDPETGHGVVRLP